jgi:hypothetical protein
MTTKPGSDERLREGQEVWVRAEVNLIEEDDDWIEVSFDSATGHQLLSFKPKDVREAALADSPGVVTDARSAETGELGLPITSPLGQSASIPESAAPAPSSVGQTRVEESAMASASDDYDWTAACLHLLMCGKDPSCKRCREIEAHIKATGGDSHD